MKINNFRGELTDVSAKKEALVPWLLLVHSHRVQQGALKLVLPYLQL